MIDVTAISSKAGAEIISRTVEEISKKIEEDTDLWCICEMAKMYMRGVKPVYPVRQKGKWILIDDIDDPDDQLNRHKCSECGRIIKVYKGETLADYPFCHCGADMRGTE